MGAGGTRGNQRDTDRARALARAAKKGKAPAKEKDGLTAQQRRDRDAAALAEKQARKAAAKEAGGDTGGGGKKKGKKK